MGDDAPALGYDRVASPDPEGQTGRPQGRLRRACGAAKGTQTAVFAAQHRFPRKRPRNVTVGHGGGQPRCAAQPGSAGSAPYNRRRTTLESRPGHSLRNFGFSRAGRTPRLQAGDVRRPQRARGTRRRPGRDAEAHREICGKAGGGAADAVPADPAEHDPRPFPPPEGPEYVDDAALGAGERRRKGRRFRSARNFGRQNPTPTPTARSRGSLQQSSDCGHHRAGAWRGCRRVNGKHFCCVTGKSSMWRKLPPRWVARKAA